MNEQQATIATRLNGTCTDCGTEMDLRHENGIGGEGQAWPCLVCGNPVRLNGSAYTDAEVTR